MNTNQQADTIMALRRKIAIAAGVFFLISDVVSIAAVLLYGSVLTSPDYIVGPGSDTRVLLGALLEVIVAFSVIGTAVALYPVVRRQNEGVALGYVALRTLEAGIIVIGVVSILPIVTLRQAGIAGTDPATLTTVGRALVSIHNWTILIGPDFTSGLNTVLLAFLLYRSRLVPRFIPVLGLVGGPLVFATAIAVLFGVLAQISALAILPALPELAWELSLATYLIVKGFKPSAIADDAAKTEKNELVSAV